MPSAGSVGRRVSGAASQLILFVVVSVVAGLLLAGLALPVVGGLGLAARAGADTFEPQNLPTPPLPQVSRMLAADGSVIAAFYDQDRVDVPLSQIAPVMRDAIIAIEDSRFYEHSGLDLRGTLRALAANRNNDGRTQGGSSITQQYVKNVLLQDAVARNDKEGMRAAVVADGTEGYVRKLRELQYAIALEDRLTKDQILERYLNIAYFGQLAYGIEAASRRYFSKPAAKLTLPEAALLAGIVRNPSLYDPLRTGESKNADAYLKETVLNRRNTVLARMAELGKITRLEHAKARASKVVTKPSRVGSGCANARIGGYFCDYAVKVFLDDERYGKTRKDRENLLYRGGVTIRTTLDPTMQRAADKALDKYMDDTDNPVGTVVMIEPGTGDIKSMALNRPYGVDKKRNEFAVNLAVDARYGGNGAQPGSTFKPFLNAAALEQGFGFRYSINSPYQLTEQLRIPTCDGAIEPKNAKGTGPYDPRNESTSENGAYDMTRAMAMSVNTYFVQLQEKVGLCRPNRLVTRMGIKHAETLDPLAEVGSWTLGAQDVSPLDMAKGYATFAARGIACQERPIVGVELRDGKRIDGPAADCARVLEPEVADAVNHLLQNVVRNGTGTPAAIGRPQAGKTGTSESFTAWFVGYTPDLAAAVSIWDPRGRERRYDLADVKIGGQVWERVQGRQIPAPIWGAAMKAALKGVAPTPFKVVEGRFFDGTQGRGDFKAPRVPKPERPAVETPTRPDPPKPQQPKPPKPDPCEGPKCPKPANPKPPKPPKPPADPGVPPASRSAAAGESLVLRSRSGA